MCKPNPKTSLSFSMFPRSVYTPRRRGYDVERCHADFHVESKPFYGLEEFNKSLLLDSNFSETVQHVVMATSSGKFYDAIIVPVEDGWCKKV